MKTALLIVPTLNGCAEPDRYLSDCIQRLQGEGILVLSANIYRNYAPMDQGEFINKTLPVCDEVVIFEDFKNADNSENSRLARAINQITGIDPSKPIRRDSLPHAINYSQQDLQSILDNVSFKTKTPIEHLKSRTRKREVVDARFIYFRRARDLTKKSLAQIGSLVGRDHASVIHGIREANNTAEVVCKYQYCFGNE